MNTILKKALLLMSIIAVSGSMVMSQTVPNMSFEDWEAVDTSTVLEQPVNWTTNNFNSPIVTGIAVSKSTDSHTGTYAARISTFLLDSGPASTPAAGILSNGQISFQDNDLSKGGSPISYLPDSLIFHFTYQSIGGSQEGLVVAYFFTNDGSGRDTVGIGVDTLPIQSSYARRAVPLFQTRMNAPAPDSVLILFFSSSNLNTNVSTGDLYIDDIEFTEQSTSIADVEALSDEIQLFPNPADNTVTIQPDKNSLNRVTQISIMNVTGRLLKQFDHIDLLSDQFQLGVDDLHPGVYFVGITFEDGTYARKQFSIVR